MTRDGASMRDIYEYAERLGPERPDVQNYMGRAARGYAAHAYRGLRRLLEDEGHNPDAPPNPWEPWPTAEQLAVTDGIEIGEEAHTGFSVFVSMDELALGVLVVGSHGPGKTNLVCVLVKELEGRT